MDGYLTADSIGGCVYQVIRSEMVKILLEKAIGKRLTNDMLGAPFHELLAGITELYGHDTPMLLRLMNDRDSQLMKMAGGKDRLMQKALKSAIIKLTNTLGKNMEDWKWGRLHQLLFEHPVGKKKPMDKVFNIGPIPIGGDTDTVHQTAFFRERGYDGSLVCPSYRQLIDLDDMRKSLNMMAPGNSGQVGSPFYGNLTESWLTGKFKKMSWGEKVRGKKMTLK